MYTAPQFVLINNLGPGSRSFARSVQAELRVEPVKDLQVEDTYKYLDVRTTYGNELLSKPLIPSHHAFLNLCYASTFDKRRADFPVRWFSQRPLGHLGNDTAHQHAAGQNPAVYYAPRYAALNTQITRAFKRLEVYAGAENLTNYRQPNPIESAAFPFSPTFDAAMVRGPVYGRLTYVGLRYRVD